MGVSSLVSNASGKKHVKAMASSSSSLSLESLGRTRSESHWSRRKESSAKCTSLEKARLVCSATSSHKR